MEVTLYFAGAKRDYDVDLEKLIDWMTIDLKRVPCKGEQISLMFGKYWLNATVSEVYTNWTEPLNRRFKERSWGDHYAISLMDIEIMEEYE